MAFDSRHHHYRPLPPPAPPAKRPPPPPQIPKRCRYHESLDACAAVYVGDWLVLCHACANAFRSGGFRILDPDGSYQGYLPPLTQSKRPG